MSSTGSRVVVVGSLNEDQTLQVDAIPAPGETVLATGTARSTGGKGANQAVAAARAGARVAMVGAVGDDDAGGRLLAALQAEGIDVSAVARDDTPSGIAIVMVAADGENAIVVAPGANAAVDADQVEAALTGLSGTDVVVVQGEIPVPAVEAAIRAATAAGARSVLNLAPPIGVDLDALHPDVLIVNEHEAAALSPGDDPGTDLARRTGGTVVVTLGAAGTLVVTADSRESTHAYRAAEVVDTTGAGDAFVGAFAAAWAAGHDVPTAAAWGAAAGSIAVGASGAQGGRATPDAIAALLDSASGDERA